MQKWHRARCWMPWSMRWTMSVGVSSATRFLFPRCSSQLEPKESMALLEPLLVAAGIKPVAKAVIGTVSGDLHDIGKNLVAMMWKGANFEVIDLGTNVSPDKFVNAAKEHNADLVGLSALLTTTMPAIKTTVEALKTAGLDVTKVVIGGAPVTQEYADQIGADGYAPDAASAVEIARSLLDTAA